MNYNLILFLFLLSSQVYLISTLTLSKGTKFKKSLTSSQPNKRTLSGLFPGLVGIIEDNTAQQHDDGDSFSSCGKKCHSFTQNITILAQKAADKAIQANNAQCAAAAGAAAQVQVRFSDMATAAARTAEAAASSKQLLLCQLESDLKRAIAIADEQAISIDTTQENFKLAVEAANQAADQLTLLTRAMQDAGTNFDLSIKVLEATNLEASKISQQTGVVFRRVQHLRKRLELATCDFRRTKVAAYKAVCAAAEAKQRASKPYCK